jgi:dTDP-4-dehydrorhamnose 3,5-epimerase
MRARGATAAIGRNATRRTVTCAPVPRITARLDGLILIEPTVLGDERGFFAETYRQELQERWGIPAGERFVQDNHSRSVRGVLRGMHFQVGAGAAKLVRCSSGRIFDVAVDLRQGSPTYGAWDAIELDGESLRQLYIPVGFAHGFCVLSDVADVIYKQTAYYDGALERGIAYDDPDVAIEWPLGEDELIVSERDGRAPRLREIAQELPFRWHP